MRLSAPLVTIFLSLTALPNAYAGNETDPIKRAELALTTLQKSYNGTTGGWGIGWWHNANVMNIIAQLAKVDPNPSVQDLAARIFANTAANTPAHNFAPDAEAPLRKRKRRTASEYTKGYDENGIPFTTLPDGWDKIDEIKPAKLNARDEAVPVYDPYAFLDGFYDDDLWWALAFIGAYDVTEKTEYLKLSEGIFNAVARTWPSSCGGGGIYWNNKKKDVNAIANELFFSTAAHLANRATDPNKYADWAVKSVEWFVASGMINDDGLINDGLTAAPECKNNKFATWSYNQGVILGGLTELNKIRPSVTYIDLANRLAKASISKLSDKRGIIQDPCGDCGDDVPQFKGIYMRGLMALQVVSPDPAYVESIKKNADSVWNANRNSKGFFSNQWSGFDGKATATHHSSGMEALIAAIAVE